MGYVPFVNQLLRLNYLAGYALPPLRDIAEFGVADRAKSPRNAADPVRSLVYRGDISGAYRRYQRASHSFPLYPGGSSVRNFINDVLIPLAPGPKTAGFLAKLLKEIPDEIVDLIPSFLSLASPGAALKPVLRELSELVLKSLSERLDPSQIDVIRLALGFAIDGDVDAKAVAKLVLSLLRTDSRGAGIADAIDLLSGEKIEKCDNIIALLERLGFLSIKRDKEKIVKCCNDALALVQKDLEPRDVLKLILDELSIQPDQRELVAKAFDSIRAIANEIRRDKPTLSIITKETASLLKDLIGTRDERVQALIDAIVVLGHGLELVENLRVAVDEFKRQNNRAAVEAVAVAGDKLAEGAVAAGANGLGQAAKNFAAKVRNNQEALVVILALLGALGIGGDDKEWGGKLLPGDGGYVPPKPGEEYGCGMKSGTIPKILRDDPTVLNTNIEGGVPKGYEGHHLIGVSEAQKSPLMQHAANLGYDINRKHNGAAFPSYGDKIGVTLKQGQEESLRTGLPLHRGRHAADVYTGCITLILKKLEGDYRAGLIPDEELCDILWKWEERILSALIDRKIWLNPNDPLVEAGKRGSCPSNR